MSTQARKRNPAGEPVAPSRISTPQYRPRRSSPSDPPSLRPTPPSISRHRSWNADQRDRAISIQAFWPRSESCATAQSRSNRARKIHHKTRPAFLAPLAEAFRRPQDRHIHQQPSRASQRARQEPSAQFPPASPSLSSISPLDPMISILPS